MNDPVIVAARRTPISVRGGRLSALSAEHLAAAVLRACLDDAHAMPVGDVVLGNCMGPGGNIARIAALAAGLPVEVPGVTIDRQCGSGLSAIILAGDAIRAGDPRLHLAGGVESASTAPQRIAHGAAYSRAPFAPEGFPDPEMGPAAQALAHRYGVDRAAQDAYAARSHRLALDAQRDGRFEVELVPLDELTQDDGPRESIASMLPRFRPLYPDQPAPTVTAGNSCRISDGAAAVAIVPHSERGTAPGLRLLAHATVGCDPALPGLGPLGAVQTLLSNAGLTLDSISAFEIVEAFSAQALPVLQQLGLASGQDVDPRVCADGGALALGHPWGASGAVGVVRLFTRLVRSGAPAGSLGIATAAVGGGMGVAALVEVIR